jgi:hypothetical protein
MDNKKWKCPKCGGINPAKWDHCLGCRSPRPDSTAPQSVQPPTPARPVYSAASPGQNWKCPKCGGINPAKRESCLACNTPRDIDEVSFLALQKDRAALLQLLSSPDKAKRSAAAREIVKLEDDPAVHAALLNGINDPDTEMRRVFATAYLNYQYTNRQGYDNLCAALEGLSPDGRSELQEALEKRYGQDALAWWQAIAEEFDLRKSNKPVEVMVPTPKWSGAGKVAAAAAITLLTGNANAGVGIAGQQKLLLNDHIRIPPACHVCGIRTPTHELLVEKSVSTSLLGAVIAGSTLGDLTMQLKVPLCANCASLNRKDIININYVKGETGGGLFLHMYNAQVAEQYAQLNQGKVMPPKELDNVQGKPQAAAASVDLSGDATETATLHLLYGGAILIADGKFDVVFDGRPIGTGWFKKGLDLTIKTSPGTHKLQLRLLGGLRKKEYSFALGTGGAYEATFTYSNTKGTFNDDFSLHKLEGSEM